MKERDGSDSEGRPTKRARADTSAHVPPAANYEKVLLSIRNEYFDAISRDYAQHWRLPNEILISDHICLSSRVGSGEGGGRKEGEYREIFLLWWCVREGGIVKQKLLKVSIKLGKLLDSSHKDVVERREDIEKIMTFSKENSRIVRILLKSAEDVVREFHGCYFRLFDRVFYHAENGLIDVFTFWKMEDMWEYGRLRDERDASTLLFLFM